jgi:isoleucyl-tRNA synthetase
MDRYDLNRSLEPLVVFIEDLTNWYIRRSRRRFWKTENDADKDSAYTTLYAVLKELSLILAPFVPFVAEKIYQTLRSEDEPISVHLCDYPAADERHDDAELDAVMRRAIEAAGMARALRVKHKLKVRQPLAAVILVTRDEAERAGLRRVAEILQGELNVKAVRFADNEEELVDLSAKANFKTLGPRLGPRVKQAAPAVAALDGRAIARLAAGETVTIRVEGDDIELRGEDVLVNRTQKPDLVVENSGTLTVALDTHLTAELIAEGLAREFVNKVQNMRKEAEFEITDRIHVAFAADEEVRTALAANEAYVAGEILADTLRPVAGEVPGGTAWDLNGHPVTIAVNRA